MTIAQIRPVHNIHPAVLSAQAAPQDEQAARLEAGFQLLRQCHALYKAWPPAPAEGPPPGTALADALLVRCGSLPSLAMHDCVLRSQTNPRVLYC